MAKCGGGAQPSSGSKANTTCIDAQSVGEGRGLDSILNLKKGVKTFSVETGQQPPSDFVFVVDSSASMEALLESFINGFEAIPATAYPKDSRMAVMNMIAHKFDDPQTPLAAAMQLPVFQSVFPFLTLSNLVNFINAEPGYLNFINAQRVAQFKAKSVEKGLSDLTNSKFTQYDLCENAWFQPGQKNTSPATGKQKTCLGAAMQISSMVGVESGLLSVLQLLSKHKNNSPLFRKDAGVHFVFISDTHDPGNPNVPNLQDYMSKLPSFSALEKALKENSPETSFVKLHGIVPFTACEKSEWNQFKSDTNGIYGGSYLPRIEASGGVAVDMCSQSVDYKAVVNHFFNETRKLPPFQLLTEKVQNVSVLVNGKPHSDFRVLENSSVEINGLIASQNYTIDINYEY